MTEQETLTIIKNIEKHLKLKHSDKFTEQMYEFINNPDTRKESDKTYLQLISYYRLIYFLIQESTSDKVSFNKVILFRNWFKTSILEVFLNKEELGYFLNNNFALDKEKNDDDYDKYFKFVSENKIIVDLDYYDQAICERDYFINADYYDTPNYKWVNEIRHCPAPLYDLGFWL
jgi:hypothetical protein